MPNPRASTEEETAPLLDEDRRRNDSLFSALRHPARPLTNLEKILAGGAVLLLLLTATFVGLFAGAETALKRAKGGQGGGGRSGEPVTVTSTTTAHATATTTLGTSPTGKPSANICLTPQCIVLSATLLQALNTSVDPCENFYEYAVGGWKATHTIAADRSQTNSFSEVDDSNKKLLKNILSSIPASLSDSSSTEEKNLYKLKATFDSCMDVDKLNEVGVEPLIKLTDHIIENFAAFDDVPASENDTLLNTSDEWRGSWHEAYVASEELLASLDNKEALELQKSGARIWDKSVTRASKLDEEVPVASDDERRDRITKTLAWLHSRGASGLVDFSIEGDVGGDDPQMQSLYVYQASGGLGTKEYYEEKPVLDLYHSVIANILVELVSKSHHRSVKRGLLEDVVEDIAIEAEKWPFPWPGSGDDDGDDKDKPAPPKEPKQSLEERMDSLAGKVVAFERELMRAGADLENLFNPHYAYNPYSTKKVGKALPFLDIPTYLSAFAIRSFPENITVTHPPYLKSVTRLVDKTPDHVLSAYFAIRLALEYGSSLGYDTVVWQQTRRLQEVLRGLKPGTKEVREDVCLRWMDNIVGYIAGGEFVREAFGPDSREDAENIINSVIKAFHDHLPSVPWMDEESAKAAQIKANAIRPRIGYSTSPNVTDPESLARWYNRLDVDADDFFGNVLRSTFAEEYRTWQTLGKRRDDGTWEMTPQTVNAYYQPSDSEITFPAGILQPPFYSKNFPAHMNYGAFGAVAAHELTHAFDNTGAQFDERGRLRDWWTKDTVAAFEERAQCIAKQYSKYYILDAEGKKVYVNGNLTNGENIGDSGISQAFAAWKNSQSAKADSKEPSQPLRLPGLEYSDEQLFFLAYARIWADLIRPATAVQRIRSDPHSPNVWRVMGTLKNSDEFHEAWGCKPGSAMNPPKEDQCRLW